MPFSNQSNWVGVIYSLFRLLGDLDRPIETIFQESIELLLPSWQHPELACARINCAGHGYQTDNFAETEWRLSSDVELNNEITGSITVTYLEQPANSDDGAFTRAEIELIDMFARELGVCLERRQARNAQRRNEASLAAAQRVAKIGSWELDLVTHEFSCSDELNRIFGLDLSDGESTYKEFINAIYPEDREETEMAIHAALHINEPLDIEHRVAREDGEIRIVHERAAVTTDEAGNPLHIVGAAQDITERKQAEEEAKAMEIQLRQAQKLESIGQLAAGIAHEINTPTQFVSDNTRFIQESFEDLGQLIELRNELINCAEQGTVPPEILAKQKQLVEEIELDYLMEEVPRAIEQSLDGLQRISKIVRAMKEFSHPGSEEKTPININNAIESTIDVSSNEWKYSADIIKELDANLPLVPCLPGEFNQVILNTIINAAHAIAEALGENSGQKGTITIQTRQEEGWARIAISDTGTGIPEEIRSKIFDPFFTTKEVGRGTGQGLSIAYSVIVDKHDGRVDVESEVGQGSTFIFRLPLTVQEATEPKEVGYVI